MNDWQKIKDKDIPRAEQLLRDIESDYVTACGRFLSRRPAKDSVWTLSGKKGEISALIVKSGSTLLPVLCGIKEIPFPRFIKGLFGVKKIHSAQGKKEEVIILENIIEKTGKPIVDIFDYDLMSLESLPGKNRFFSAPAGLVLRPPQMTDLDSLAPLQGGYEKEEVLPKGSVFNPLASRINTANIIAQGLILAAELNGRIVGKINVNAVSFTRCQIGGVYVHPDFRGMGIARRMTEEFIAFLMNQNRKVTLFVKKNNIPAQRLYASLGFKASGDYRITYY